MRWAAITLRLSKWKGLSLRPGNSAFPLLLSATPTGFSQELAKYDLQGLDIVLQHASEVVGMHDSASDAVRKKKDSSIRVAFELVKERCGRCRCQRR